MTTLFPLAGQNDKIQGKSEKITAPDKKRLQITYANYAFSDLRQLNKNLFGSDDDSDEDEPAAPAKKSEPEPIATRPLQNADDFFKFVNITPVSSC